MSSKENSNTNSALFKEFLSYPFDAEKFQAYSLGSLNGIPTYEMVYPSQWIQKSKIGYLHPPSTRVRSAFRTKDEIIYDKTYSFDEFSRRTLPSNEILMHKEKFLILFGCSFTYGEGLSDDETLSYYLFKESKSYTPYNYGVGGSGPHMMLAMIEEYDFRKQIQEINGHAVYVFLHFHIPRANGFMQELSWLASAPKYNYDKDGNLYYAGSFGEAQYYRTKIFNFFYSSFFEPLGIRRNMPRLTNRHVNYTCDLIKTAKKKFQAVYPSSRFIVYNHPSSIDFQKIQDCLSQNDILFYDGKTHYQYDPADALADGHPSAQMNKKVASDLLRFLKMEGPAN